MIINELTVCDFRVFQGEHVIDLAPRVKYNSTRPIVLFGGLNGAGKTSILSAIRLVLYGRQSLGAGTSQKEYDEYLRNSIHLNKNALVQPKGAFISLSITYSSYGVLTKYLIKRSWYTEKNSVIEKLTIYKSKDDDPETLEELKEFSTEQCQGFLNELIPIGVSDLYFFDGEKIAELAEDDTGTSLGTAIRKLIGLDIIERLNNDLSIHLREQRKQDLPSDMKKQIDTYDKDYKVLIKQKEKEISTVHELNIKITALAKDIDKLETQISEKGGEWAKTRDSEKQKQAELLAKKDQLQQQLRDLAAGAFPLSIGSHLLDNLLIELQQEDDFQKQKIVSDVIKKRVQRLKRSTKNLVAKTKQDKLSESIDKVFADLILDKTSKPDIVHDLSETEFEKIKLYIEETIPTSKKQTKKLSKQLTKINEELEFSSLRLGRAPDAKTISKDFDKLKALLNEKAELLIKQKSHIEEARKLIRDAMDVMRKMRDLDKKYRKSSINQQAFVYAENTRELLTDFSQKMAERKIQSLEQEFVNSFRRLARKDDILIQARIDIADFTVTLHDESERPLNKKRLSAGEKQIYAIAMLEALARTAGKKLPIIIDTPLGRLDSKHRTKLVEHYFPKASHQVIILSTDTEVDESFYTQLSPEISHAFSIEYDPKEGSSNLVEGYFWRQPEREQAYAT